MRKTVILLGAATLALAACGEGADNAAVPETTPRQSVFDDPIPEPRQVLASELLMVERTPRLTFTWRAPPELAAYPDLLDRLRDEASASLRDARAQAIREADTHRGDPPRPPLAYDQEWRVAYENEGLMNLVSETYTYMGGAHGNTAYRSIFWDKGDERVVEPPALFVNWPEAQEMLVPRYCEALNDMRETRRGTPVAEGATDDFSACPSLAEQPVAFDGRSFEGLSALRVLLAPYEAGPYAEGSYEVEIPADAALLTALKARYRPPMMPAGEGQGAEREATAR